MVTGVEIEFASKPNENEIHLMRLAAKKLTKDPFRIEIEKSDDFPKKATVTRAATQNPPPVAT